MTATGEATTAPRRREPAADLRLQLQRDGRWRLWLPVARTRISCGNQVVLTTRQLRSWHLIEGAVLEQLSSYPVWSPGSARRWRLICAELVLRIVLGLTDLWAVDIWDLAQSDRDAANEVLAVIRRQTGREAA